MTFLPNHTLFMQFITTWNCLQSLWLSVIIGTAWVPCEHISHDCHLRYESLCHSWKKGEDLILNTVEAESSDKSTGQNQLSAMAYNGGEHLTEYLMLITRKYIAVQTCQSSALGWFCPQRETKGEEGLLWWTWAGQCQVRVSAQGMQTDKMQGI